LAAAAGPASAGMVEPPEMCGWAWARRVRAKLKTLAPGGHDVILVSPAAFLSFWRAELIRWSP
jgi:hypothetical protein